MPSAQRVVLEHEAIDGYMDAMTMPFSVTPGTVVAPGDVVEGTLEVGHEGSVLVDVRVVGHRAVSPVAQSGVSIRSGQRLPDAVVALAGGGQLALGAQQRGPLALSLIYTTCPMPEFCPAITRRFQELQTLVAPGEATLLGLTLDNEGDTDAVLLSYASSVDADAKVWRFGRVSDASLAELALAAGMQVDRAGDEIVHGVRLLVFDVEGSLIERYDDARWDNARVASQLKTGKPTAPTGVQGTVSPK